MTQAQLEALLHRLTERLAGALRAEPFDLRVGHQVGAELVAAHIASAEGLGRTVEVIQLRLLRDLGLVGRRRRGPDGPAAGHRRHRLRPRAARPHARRAGVDPAGRHGGPRAGRAGAARQRGPLPPPGHPRPAHRPAQPHAVHRAAHRRASPSRAGAPTGSGSASSTSTGSRWSTTRLGHQVGDALLAQVAAAAAPGPRRAPGGPARRRRVRHPGRAHRRHRRRGRRSPRRRWRRSRRRPWSTGTSCSVTASVGIVERPVAGTTPGELMRAADSTLHWAKAAGGARWALFDPARNRTRAGPVRARPRRSRPPWTGASSTWTTSR